MSNYPLSEYTSIEEMEDVFSEAGITNWSDDDNDGERSTDETNRLRSRITAATRYVAKFLWEHYEINEVSDNPWVREKATLIACHYTSRRRGNPEQFRQEFEDITKELEEIRWHEYSIPLQETQGYHGPSVTPQVVDYRYGTCKLREQQQIQVGPKRGSQQPDPYTDLWCSGGQDGQSFVPGAVDGLIDIDGFALIDVDGEELTDLES